MRIHFAIAIWSCLIYSSGIAQNRGNVWMLGNDFYEFRNGRIDFSSGMPDTFFMYRKMSMYNTQGIICDTTGSLLFYTNGQWIANFDHDTLKGSENFNPGWATDTFYCPGVCFGLGLMQAVLILPHPDSKSKFDLFHITCQKIDPVKCQPLHLSHSLIDMSLNSGKGEMIAKNEFLIEDTLTNGRLTACKHANGRDWWIISHEFNTNRYYIFLLTPDSIYGPISQNIGQSIYVDNAGMACVSPDGNYYSIISPVIDHKLDILKFDRCTGMFTDVIVSEVLPQSPTYWWLSIAFSPDSRFLYAISEVEIWQYDLQAVDVQGSKMLVAVWDTLYAIFSTKFFLAQIAPDNKIYVSTSNFDSLLHVIDQPNELGTACNVLQNYNGVKLPTDNVTLPNLPNYDLGALPGSPCDTLTTIGTAETVISDFKVMPNPASDWLNIVYSSQHDASFELYDLYGHKVAEVQLYHYFKNRLLSVRSLPEGVYGYKIFTATKESQSGKIAVIHSL